MGRSRGWLAALAIAACSDPDTDLSSPSSSTPTSASSTPSVLAPAPATVVSLPTIRTFSASRDVVDFGESVVLSWSVDGAPDDVRLDGASVAARSSFEVQPARRQRFTLEATKGTSVDRRTIEVASRGLDLAAGVAAAPGALDGPLDRATFDQPYAIATGADGAVYVIDNGTRTIRKITTEGASPGVTTIARAPAVIGASAIAVDAAGTVYISTSSVIRAIAPDGTVASFAGAGDGTVGLRDGAGAQARFRYPYGLVALPSGELLVVDTGNAALRKIAPDRTVTTIALAPGSLTLPRAAAVDAAGTIFVADGCSVRRVGTDGSVVTYAGGECTHPFQETFDATTFGEIGGLAVDASGDLYIGDLTAQAIRRVRGSDRSMSIVAGGEPFMMLGDVDDGLGRLAHFTLPKGIALRKDGSIVIADLAAHLIRSMTTDGVVSTLAGVRLRIGEQDGPLGVHRTGAFIPMTRVQGGAVALADTWFNTIRMLAPDGSVRTLAGGSRVRAVVDGMAADARFASPYAIASDPSGSLYVSELAGSVRRIAPNGEVTTIAKPTSFVFPNGIVRDTKGNLFVTDGSRGRIDVIRPDGTIEPFIGQGPTGRVQDGVGTQVHANSPHALAIGRDDTLYFADSGYVIRKASPAGVVTTIAGVLNAVGHRDGAAHEAWFSDTIRGLAVDDGGQVFVSDTSNHAIRVITTDGSVRTVAGAPDVRGLTLGRLPASLYQPGPIAVTASGDVLVSCGSGIVQVTAP